MTATIAKLRSGIFFLKEHKKELFWYWIGYQCIKGALTTSFIWIPLLIAYWH
jgi:hypothetical protein